MGNPVSRNRSCQGQQHVDIHAFEHIADDLQKLQPVHHEAADSRSTWRRLHPQRDRATTSSKFLSLGAAIDIVILQGLENVPEELCTAACLLVANRSNTGTKSFTNVKGCFAIMSGQYMTNCNYNKDTSVVCTPPCGADGNLGELCLTQSMKELLV